MKVLILSTYARTGGAAIAASRLMYALRTNGVEATMLSRRDIPWWPKRLKPQSYTSLWERLVIFLHLLVKPRTGSALGNSVNTPLLSRMKRLWALDIANCGQDITRTREYKEADVIHMHWINQGFISLSTIEKILRSGKRVVWTMHDEWPLESVEHYVGDERYTGWLEQKVRSRKQKVYSEGRITFVACSQWLADIARQKPLGQGQEVLSIPNPIDVTTFQPIPGTREEFGLPADKPVILFGCQKVTDKRKGLDYLIEAARQLKDVEIALVGANTDETALLIPSHIRTHSLGTIRDTGKMARLYSACDCFVTPSLQDNLPNTIMEAMACGTPCVGFRVGGIPEMIDHEENGYVAEYRSAEDLADGIRYVLDAENRERLSLAARQKVWRCYSETAVAEQYLKVYGNTLSNP